MKKQSESPLQQQANKRFLGQITGLEAAEQANKSKSGWQKLISKFKHLL